MRVSARAHLHDVSVCAYSATDLASSCSSKKKVQSALLLIADVKMILADRMQDDVEYQEEAKKTIR